jgi:hypothetical protein
MASTEDANATRQLPHREGQGGSAVQREDAGIGSSGQPRPAEALGAQPNPWKMKAILTLGMRTIFVQFLALFHLNMFLFQTVAEFVVMAACSCYVIS